MKPDAVPPIVAALLCLQLVSTAPSQKEPTSNPTKVMTGEGQSENPGREIGHAAIDFGAKGQCRIWLAVAQHALFVDRNGNGDPGDPDERVAPNDRGDFVTDVPACDEKGRKGTFRLSVSVARDADGKLGIKSLSVNPIEDIQRFHSSAGFISLGKSRADAPIVPIHGPLCFVLMDHWTGSTACRLLPEAGGEHEFSILVATPVHRTKGEAYVYPNLWLLEPKTLPVIRVEFKPRDPRAGTTTPGLSIWMCECARRYRCKLRVPASATTLGASLHMSFPGWRHGMLKPVTLELRYGKPDSKSHLSPAGGSNVPIAR